VQIEPLFYRLAARAMFAPFGGLDSMRRRLLDALELKPGERVLELGCGPGDITAGLLSRGATVHAIDRSLEMLSVAAKRAPGANLERADLRNFAPQGAYDVVLIAFVLHELDIEDAKDVIARATSVLDSGGRLAIIDHALPPGFGRTSWRAILRGVESRKIDAWLDLDVSAVLSDAGMGDQIREELAEGRAQLIIATRR
jgi:demethylmenaquinone methyltransferase/2-methoxy-6-polyprenyl-1,4-benzoquinol methylase